jgi:hypothetical protein
LGVEETTSDLDALHDHAVTMPHVPRESARLIEEPVSKLCPDLRSTSMASLGSPTSMECASSRRGHFVFWALRPRSGAG